MRPLVAALVCVLGAAVALPEGANPRAAAPAQQPITVRKAAPANATVGQLVDYTITLEHAGDLTDRLAITVTDALPAQVTFQAWGITPNGTCPTRPAPGQGGTVSCTAEFTPTVKTIVITIQVVPVTAGTVTNTVQLSTGESASATTSVGPATGPPPGSATPQPAPPGSIVVAMTGPETIVLDPQRAPARFNYAITLTYAGPPALLGGAGVTARWSVRLPVQIRSPGYQSVSGNSFDCVAPPPSGAPPEVFSCTSSFTEAQRAASFFVSARPTGELGLATAVVEVATGATASWTTNLVRAQPPPAPAPEPVPGPPAAPTKTVAETFTRPGETETQSATIAASAKTTQVALTWPDADSSFDATGFRIVRGGQVVARAPQSVVAKVRPGKLRVSKRRTARSLDVRIKGLKPGKLIYRIVARRLDGRTRVVAKVRQSRRG